MLFLEPALVAVFFVFENSVVFGAKILKFERIIFSNFENPAVSSLQILLKKMQNATSKEG
jgi:hypothetical protein